MAQDDDMQTFRQSPPIWTNADRLRQMTDDQLAEFITDCEFNAYNTYPTTKGEVLAWLQSRAKPME
jgi:hypothetical protein